MLLCTFYVQQKYSVQQKCIIFAALQQVIDGLNHNQELSIIYPSVSPDTNFSCFYARIKVCPEIFNHKLKIARNIL